MAKILIADACKPSLVMTSEIFKDKVTGTEILVAKTGKEALDHLEEHVPDLCVIDFDLPDVDGPALVAIMRQSYQGPILMTAFPGDIVKQAVKDQLYACNDASDWIAKPIAVEEMAAKIERYLLDGFRIGKRFSSEIKTLLVAKASGPGKRSPRVEGKLLNLSMGGACVQLASSEKMKKTQEFTVSFSLPKQDTPVKKAKKVKKTTAKKGAADTKIRAKVAWSDGKGVIGLQFTKLSEPQKKGLDLFFKAAD